MTGAEEWKAWERSYANRVVTSINSLRAERALTIAQLADALNDLGWPVSIETLNGILSGKKRGSLSMTEVLAFAKALDVSPAYLMVGLPDLTDLPTEAVLSSEDSSLEGFYLWLTERGLLLGLRDGRGSQFKSGQNQTGLARYAEALDDLYWHNALWIAANELGVSYSVAGRHVGHDIFVLASIREKQWPFPLRAPELPMALRTVRPTTEPLSEPISGLNSVRQIAIAISYWRATETAEETAEQLRALSRGPEEESPADVVRLPSAIVHSPDTVHFGVDAISSERLERENWTVNYQIPERAFERLTALLFSNEIAAARG